MYDLSKRFEKVTKALKKYKLELVFWDHPWGTTENLILVLKGDVKDYQTAMGQSDLSETMSFYKENRTHFVMAP